MQTRKRSNIKKCSTVELNVVDDEMKIHKFPDGRITIKDAAKLLGYKLTYLYNCRDAINKPPYVKFGRNIYYYYDELVEWIRSYKNK